MLEIVANLIELIQMVIYHVMLEDDKNMEIDANKSNVNADRNNLDLSRKWNMAMFGKQCLHVGAATGTGGSNETPPKAFWDTSIVWHAKLHHL